LINGRPNLGNGRPAAMHLQGIARDVEANLAM
jgi:hypothetical protein